MNDIAHYVSETRTTTDGMLLDTQVFVEGKQIARVRRITYWHWEVLLGPSGHISIDLTSESPIVADFRARKYDA